MNLKPPSVLFLLIVAVIAASAQTSKGPATNWSDTTRDVYIDNELDRDIQVLTADAPSRLVLISSKLQSAVVLNVSDHTVSTTTKEAFRFAADRTTATADSSAEMKNVGKFTRIDGPVYFFVVESKPVVIRAHPGATGELSIEKLWETVPVWRAVMKNYEPNANAVSQIKSTDKDTTVTLAFGTWCPDSKNYVPRLLKALRTAGNDKIQITLIGVDNQFREPVAVVQPRRITNVPTVIVEREGHEIGRIVETPAAKTMEEDLASILQGKQPVHNGRWDRGPKIASGSYSYRDKEGKQIGTESWDLFSTPEGGFLVHSRITAGEQTTDVYHRVDAKRRPMFTEVTRQHGDELTRTRFTIDNSTLTARMRGNVSGVVSQTLEVPELLFLSSPAIAGQGFVQQQDANSLRVSSYVAPNSFDGAMGMLTSTLCEAKGEETVRVPAGEFRARHVVRKTDKETSEWWFHSQLGVPLKAQVGSLEYVLTSIDEKKQ
jgi:hypothetical protein